LLLASGVVTAVPLMCFGQAARRLRLSTLGFLQFLAPSLQFVCAVAVLNEPLLPGQLASFAWIWCGLAVFSVDSAVVMWARSRDVAGLRWNGTTRMQAGQDDSE
jgi:chloramphenicol-sensitive protein RarD